MSIASIAASAAVNLLGSIFGQSQKSTATQAGNAIQQLNTAHHHHHHQGGDASGITQTGTTAGNTAAGNSPGSLLNTVV